jgi:head-tail adaptor
VAAVSPDADVVTEFAGTLRERVTILAPTEARTSIGVQQFGWHKVADSLASIAPEGAGAEAQGMALSAMPRFVVTIRKRDGIAIDMRVRWGTREMAIRQLIGDPRSPDRIVMRCEEVRS